MADASDKTTKTEGAARGLPQVTPLEGTTTLDDKMTFEPERLAYRSAASAAERIAEQVAAARTGGQEIVITAGELLADLTNLVATELLLEQLVARFKGIETLAERLRPQEPAPESVDSAPPASEGTRARALAPILAGVEAGIGLLSLFRENVQFTGAKTTIDQLAFQFALAASLTRRRMTVRIYETSILPALEADRSGLRKDLQDVEDARAGAWASIAPFVQRLIDAQVTLDEASSVRDNKEEVQRAARTVTQLRQQIAPITDALEHADTQLASLRTQLEKVDESTGVMALGRLLRVERLRDRHPRYLHVRVVSSGGHHRVSRNLLRTIFVGDGVSALGGVVVRWALLDGEGVLQDGGIMDERRAANFPRGFWDRTGLYQD
jgi:hypothetical protein